MKKIAVILSATALVAVSGSAVLAAPEMRDGKWEISSTIDMPGMPFKVPPTVVSHCYTKEDVKDRKNVVTNKNEECKVTDMKVSGNKVTWKMKCTGKSKGTFSGETVFGRDFYNSTMKMETEGRTMTTKVKAKRVGDCD